jgi:hypothetical protein
MSTPGDTPDALSDITNIAGMISIINMYTTLFGCHSDFLYIYIETPTLDEASRKREQRNMQQRNRQAEMTDRQREEIKRKQREYQRDYRARKKTVF